MSDSNSQPLSNNRLERLKQTLSANYEEYKALRAEYALHLSSQHQAHTLTSILVGAVLTGSPTIVSSCEPWLSWVYILASFFFLVISWTQLRYLEANIGIRNYIILKLIPRIEQTLTYIHDDPVLEQPSVFAWEDEGIELTYRQELWLVPIIGSRILLPVAASITSLTAFIALLKVRGWFMCSSYVAITVVVGLIAYTMWATLTVLRNAQKRPHP